MSLLTYLPRGMYWKDTSREYWFDENGQERAVEFVQDSRADILTSPGFPLLDGARVRVLRCDYDSMGCITFESETLEMENQLKIQFTEGADDDE